MPALHGHVVLEIIESCDAATIETLRLMPEFRDIMETHRIGIIKRLIQAQVGGETYRGQFLLDTLGDYCGPSYAKRPVISVYNWCAIAMAERRACFVECLLQEQILFTRDDSRWPHLNDPAERETLRGMVREALHCCEVLSNIEASVIGLEDVSSFGLDKLPQESIEHAVAHQLALDRHGFRALERSEAEESREMFVRWKVRGCQGGYLEGLTTRQLLCIALLLRLAGVGLLLFSGREHRTRTWKMVRSVNEGVLRHGTAILSAWETANSGSSKLRQSHAANLLRQARQDFHRVGSTGLVWKGVVCHGLSVVLRKELKMRLRADGRHYKFNVETEVLALVDEMVRGPQTRRPTTSMFWPLPEN